VTRIYAAPETVVLPRSNSGFRGLPVGFGAEGRFSPNRLRSPRLLTPRRPIWRFHGLRKSSPDLRLNCHPCRAMIGRPTASNLTFFLRHGWQVQFVESDLKTPLPRKLTFADPGKIREVAQARRSMGRAREPPVPGTRHAAGQGACLLAITWNTNSRLSSSDATMATRSANLSPASWDAVSFTRPADR
jgi:hypothetical protein